MKRFYILLLLLVAGLPYCVNAQVITYKGEKFVSFTRQFPEDTTLTGVDWQRERLESTFTLQGKTPLTYRIKPLNDTLMELWQFKDAKWHLQEHIEYFGWALHRWDGNTIISELKITDFDHDGDEDLQCWVISNINGNEWTQLYLNDQKQQKLVHLVNTTAPRGNGIWDAPTYDPVTGFIHTELFSGAYGIQNTATYKLEGTIAQPVSMEEVNLTNPEPVYNYYTGENGKWVLTKQETESEKETYIEFDAVERPEDGEYDSIYWRGQDKIVREFSLKGSTSKCRLRIVKKGDVILEQQLAGAWQLVDSLYYNLTPYSDEGYLTPQFEVTDFNHDGLEDFVFLSSTTMHGTMPYYIYLQHPDGQLVSLKTFTIAYEDEDAWPSASYDEIAQTISCQFPGGVFGASWEATYKLEGFEPKPLQMHWQHRNTQSWIDQYFTGEDSKWVLTRQLTDIALGFGFDNYDTMDVRHYLIEEEKEAPLRLYSITGDYNPEDNYNDKTLIDTLDIGDFLSDLEYEHLYDTDYGFMITDFNEDNNHDLVFYTGIDVHGSKQAIIFLSDPKTKTLIKLYNTAEGSDLWDTPEYNPKTKTITCRRISGNAGLSFTSTYRLKGFTAEPRTKEVQDRTNVNGETGKGYSESSYTGKNGKWVLQSTVTDR